MMTLSLIRTYPDWKLAYKEINALNRCCISNNTLLLCVKKQHHVTSE